MILKKQKDLHQLKLKNTHTVDHFFPRTRTTLHLISNVQILTQFVNIIPIQTFKKWHNLCYHKYNTEQK